MSKRVLLFTIFLITLFSFLKIEKLISSTKYIQELNSGRINPLSESEDLNSSEQDPQRKTKRKKTTGTGGTGGGTTGTTGGTGGGTTGTTGGTGGGTTGTTGGTGGGTSGTTGGTGGGTTGTTGGTGGGTTGTTGGTGGGTTGTTGGTGGGTTGTTGGTGGGTTGTTGGTGGGTSGTTGGTGGGTTGTTGGTGGGTTGTTGGTGGGTSGTTGGTGGGTTGTTGGTGGGTTGTTGGTGGGTTGTTGGTGGGTSGTTGGTGGGTTGTTGGTGGGTTGTTGGTGGGTTGTTGGTGGGTTGTTGGTGGGTSGTTGGTGGGTTGTTGGTGGGTSGTTGGTGGGTTGTTGGTGGGTTGTTGGTGGGTGTTEGAESSGDQTATGIAESRNFELLVEPYRNAIYSGEQTTISIDLHEFNPAGEKIQGFRQEVDINVTGIIDGTVSHKTGKIILDNIGIAWIEYRAGQQDKQIKITATFTPPGYPEKAKGEATINVKPLEYDATLTLKGSYDKTENSSFKQAMGWGDSEITHDLNENLEASIYVPLKMENAYDVEAQNLRYEYYRPLDINLSSFYASHRSKDFKSDISSDEGGKTTVLKNKIPSDQKVSLKETMLQLDIILTIDLKTDKVVKINMDGFTVEFIWKETVDTHHESWWKPPPAPGHETTDKTDSDTEDDNFCVCPVEDLIPDPIVTSSTEAIKKYLKDLGVALPENAELPEEEPLLIIAPDLLVKFGDGKTYFGGEGQKIIDNSEGSTIRLEKLSFSWQVTRKKKPL